MMAAAITHGEFPQARIRYSLRSMTVEIFR